MTRHTPFHITVRGIIVSGETVFCQKLKHADGAINDFWATPGGHLEANESIAECLHREMIEETGVAPVVGKLLFTQQYTTDDAPYLELFYHITNADDYQDIDLKATSHGDLEIAEYGFVDPRTHTILPECVTIENITQALASAETANFTYF